MKTPPRQRILEDLARVGREHSDATVIFHATVASMLDLHPTDYKTLGVVERLGPLTAGDVAKLSGLATASVTNLLDRLESRGFVRRVRDPEDRRRVLVEPVRDRLTAGRVVFASSIRSLERLFQRYSDAELVTICDFLARNGRRLREETGRLRVTAEQLAQQTPAQAGPGKASKSRLQPTQESATGTPMAYTFAAKVFRGKTKNVTGIVVPDEIVQALSAGRRPPVEVTLNGYTYRSTVGSMGGRFMIPLSAEHRRAAGLEGGEEIEVRLKLDEESRETPLPDDLKRALTAARRLATFQAQAPSRRKEHVRQVETAKAAETRARRIAKIVESLPKGSTR